MNTFSRFKNFPPGWNHLKIPVSSRRAALAGLSMYSACRPRAVWLQQAAYTWVRVFGPRLLPGRSRVWDPPADGAWPRIASTLEAALGPFDEIAGYLRVQRQRRGMALLLLRRGAPIAFVKLRQGDAAPLTNEANALNAVAAFGPKTFHAPTVLRTGEAAGWSFLAVSPLPEGPHHPPASAPLRDIVNEVKAALARLPRPADVPAEWQPMHGDFAPWNLRESETGPLFLVDWESAGWGPPSADETYYVATSAALARRPAPAHLPPEAARFWRERMVEQPDNARDRRLARSLLEVLDQMSAGTTAAQGRSDDAQHAGARDGAVQVSARPSRPRALVFAYACEPERGSEPAGGWGVVRTLSDVADCVVLVGPEHGPGIARWQAREGCESIEFVEVPEPPWGSWAKAHRITWFLLYLAWLRRADAVGRRLHRTRGFDLACHATYSAYWLPSPATRYGIPSIWGPVGGAVTTPLALWPVLGWRGILDELLDRVSVRIMAALPPTKKSWTSATVGLIQNDATAERLPAALRARSVILNHALLAEVPPVQARTRAGYCLYVGALDSRKGPRLAVHALAHSADEVRLVLVGRGRERKAVLRLARRLGVAHRLELRGSVPREEVQHLLAEASAAVFTGLREEGGIALAEALTAGIPVIVLGHGGARVLAEAAPDRSRVVIVEPQGVHTTARLFGAAMTRFVRTPIQTCTPNLDLQPARHAFHDAVRLALASAARVSGPAG